MTDVIFSGYALSVMRKNIKTFSSALPCKFEGKYSDSVERA